MNFNFDLFIDILWLGTVCGIISTVCLQKLKETTKLLNYKLASVVIHICIGYCVSRLFTNLPVKLSICVGIITWIGAETIYEKLNGKKLLPRSNNVNNNEYINTEEKLNEDLEALKKT